MRTFIDFTTAFGHCAVDADKASATVKDGIITIKMPKAPESEAEAATQVLIPVSGTVNEDNLADGNAYDLTLVAAGFNASEITVEAQKNAQPHRMQQDGLLRITGESSRLKRKKLDEEVARLHLAVLLLRPLGFFKHLPRDTLEAAASLFEPRYSVGRQLIYRQGEVADALYVVAEGKCTLRHPAKRGGRPPWTQTIDSHDHAPWFGVAVLLVAEQPRAAGGVRRPEERTPITI